MNTNINVVDGPNSIPFKRFELYINTNFYSALINCGISAVIFLLLLYVVCQLGAARRTVADLPVYLGMTPSSLEENDDDTKANPPYFSTTTKQLIK